MIVEFNGYDWDNGNRGKCQKHGVSLQTIEWFFKQQSVFIAPDIKHSQSETRHLAVGCDENGRPMFIAFTFRYKNGEKYLRPISARYMHKKEAECYEQENP